jgi:NADH dehydrogenase FAD-containing subunit
MTKHQIVIVGGGAAGIATASSLRSRDASLDCHNRAIRSALLSTGMDNGWRGRLY